MSKYTIYFDDNTYLEIEAARFKPAFDENYIILLDDNENDIGLVMMMDIQAIISSDAINPEDNERLAKKDGELSEDERREMNRVFLEECCESTPK